MTHTLELTISHALYERLVTTAQQTGQTIETLVTEWLDQRTQPSIDDPIEAWIGALDSGGSDWLDAHDVYLGKHAGNLY